MNQCQFCKPLDRQNIALIEPVMYGCFYCTVIMTTVRVLCMYNQPLRGAWKRCINYICVNILQIMFVVHHTATLQFWSSWCHEVLTCMHLIGWGVMIATHNRHTVMCSPCLHLWGMNDNEWCRTILHSLFYSHETHDGTKLKHGKTFQYLLWWYCRGS